MIAAGMPDTLAPPLPVKPISISESSQKSSRVLIALAAHASFIKYYSRNSKRVCMHYPWNYARLTIFCRKIRVRVSKTLHKPATMGHTYAVNWQPICLERSSGR
jgi:hypothetical protein